ncbi:phosphatidylserine decarboxylase [Lentinus tigrinus ALCF2SS1-6]|uniref:Phosphatidylserine decarboxylase proenzyme 1, mitochondrial n=1 Tax=Lentinus tigrinus ALCF2SS1-6 TaxID=1328759 RepID=A0A5C2S8D7_9APHY|nr:phosphatidylserine decarboxylase [Lentinus tigrinus ALCF2SS1-6]
MKFTQHNSSPFSSLFARRHAFKGHLARSGAFIRRSTVRFLSQESRNNYDNSTGSHIPLYRRLVEAWQNTPTKWYPLPVAAGALLLIVIQYRKRSTAREVVVDEDGHEVIKLKGPWHVHVIGALPLRNLSRVWGYLNSLELPVWLRPIGFRVYASIFGCNLEEIDPQDLTQYASLGEFFYRKLKDGARPIADAVLVSPADGRVLHFGVIKDGRIEQVKGSTYSLDALLGVARPGFPAPTSVEFPEHTMEEVNHKHFAEINGIEYSLQELLGTSTPSSSGASTPVVDTPAYSDETAQTAAKKHGERIDASVPRDQYESETVAEDVSMATEVGIRPMAARRDSFTSVRTKPGNNTFFIVIYLAPGDYHRFHSPTAWVVERRRHFVGDLFSVSPWMAKRLENLFVLNERVALLGRWKHGFFSMVPVGATNVGSIKINFDKALRTNVGKRRDHPVGTFTEAVYSGASPILNGQPLPKGVEMGGFCLGSTIVLVFEAPHDFDFAVSAGQKVKVGQMLGDVTTERSSQ